MDARIRRASLALLFALATLGIAHAQPVQPYRPSPIFQGQSLPEPPHQRDPWTPPKTNLPEKCLSSIQAIINYGFANPRACEYREVELPCGSAWGGSYVFKTHAWVLPSKDANETQRFAVSWSGLVYPTVAVGDPADLKADIAALAKPPLGDYRAIAPMESDLIWHANHNELKVCSLLLLGETEAAEQLWQALQKLPATHAAADPFLRFAHQFAWANYDRAVTAHMRGDDVISLLSAQAAQKIRDGIENDAATRGLERPTDSQAKPALYLSFLSNIDILAADEQRRLKAEKVQRVLELGVDKFPDQKQRIAALIRDLEEVNATQDSQPGGVDLGRGGIIPTLVKEGEAAIDPLIQCFETDTRLTRSVSFHRSFFTNRNLLGVDDAAFRAISDILKVRTFGPHTEHGYYSPHNTSARAEVAKEIRAYWNKVRGVAELDRWYQTLADDKASAQQWLETVRKIIGPVPRDPGIPIPPRMVVALGPPRPLAGEDLRDRKSPAVSLLLRRRGDDVAAQNHGTSHRVYSQRDACEITLALGKWEPRAAISEIRKRIQQCKELFKHEFHADHAKLLAPWFSRLCAAGIDAGDEFAADECAQWLKTLSPKKLEFGETTGVFYALCRFAEHPKLSEAAKSLFLMESPYLPLHTKVERGRFTDYVGWPLIGVPEFRQMVKQELQNKVSAGVQLTIDKEKGYYGLQGSGRIVNNVGDPAWPDAKDQPMRVCDLYAGALTGLKGLEGAPVFEPYWPLDRRDAAIADLVSFLDQWGHCFRLLPTVSFDRFRHPFKEAEFHLPKLDRPATPDDVKLGRAIFSLQEGKSEIRQANLPMFPQMARWITLDKFPVRYQGQTGPPTEFDRSGYIWQAEEVLLDGQWQRFYGFIGNHIIAKVPADEIELLDGRTYDRFLRR